MTDIDGLLKPDARGSELDALIERLTQTATQSRAHGWDGDAKDCDDAAAALVQLRERIAALEAERDEWKTEAELRRERKIRCEELEAERDKMRASLDRIVSAYDAYRGKGMLPAPNQYAMLIAAIDAAREKP